MEIEFDPVKAAANWRKHGVDFAEAATCLLDAQALVFEDFDIEGEQRCVLVGLSSHARLLTVIYTLRGENPRLISARRATAKEELSYAS